MDVLRLDVQFLVVLHQLLALIAKFTASFLEEAAQLDQVKDGDLFAATDTNEVKHEFSH